MNTLSFDLGVNEYQLAPDCIVKFNPTDTEFIQRLYNAIESLSKEDERYRKSIKDTEDAKLILEAIDKADKKMREIIDSVFNVPVCASVFGDMHVTARSSNGVPVFMEFFMAIIDQCDIDLTGLDGAGTKYVDKYTKKYMKKYGK